MWIWLPQICIFLGLHFPPSTGSILQLNFLDPVQLGAFIGNSRCLRCLSITYSLQTRFKLNKLIESCRRYFISKGTLLILCSGWEWKWTRGHQSLCDEHRYNNYLSARLPIEMRSECIWYLKEIDIWWALIFGCLECIFSKTILILSRRTFKNKFCYSIKKYFVSNTFKLNKTIVNI